MPAEHLSFHLKPSGFFSCSPAADVPTGNGSVSVALPNGLHSTLVHGTDSNGSADSSHTLIRNGNLNVHDESNVAAENSTCHCSTVN